jgi:hypothetical protein
LSVAAFNARFRLDAVAAGPPGILVDATHAVMTTAQLAQLMEYSTTVPTGALYGKRWRRRIPWDTRLPLAQWMMGEYEPDPDPDYVVTRWREILLVDEGGSE